MILEEKKLPEKFNQKYIASHFKNLFGVYQGNTSAASNAAANSDFSSFNRWKNSLNSSSNGNNQLKAGLGVKINKCDMQPIKEEKSECSSELISYEDIYLKKRESNCLFIFLFYLFFINFFIFL